VYTLIFAQLLKKPSLSPEKGKRKGIAFEAVPFKYLILVFYLLV